MSATKNGSQEPQEALWTPEQADGLQAHARELARLETALSDALARLPQLLRETTAARERAERWLRQTK